MKVFQRQLEDLLKMIGCNDANVRPEAARKLEEIIRLIALDQDKAYHTTGPVFAEAHSVEIGDEP